MFLTVQVQSGFAHNKSVMVSWYTASDRADVFVCVCIHIHTCNLKISKLTKKDLSWEINTFYLMQGKQLTIFY